MKTTYSIQDKEAGNVIETGLTYEDTRNTLIEMEETDMGNGVFKPDRQIQLAKRFKEITGKSINSQL